MGRFKDIDITLNELKEGNFSPEQIVNSVNEHYDIPIETIKKMLVGYKYT